MPKVIEGDLLAKGKTFALIVARFNDFITKELLSGCTDTLLRHGAQDKDIEIFFVPGAFEIPQVAMRLAKSKKYDALICLGAIIRGNTPHFEYIASETAKGIAKVALDSGLPLAFGVITADTIEQAIERAGTKEGNKGKDAALQAIEMANLFSKIK